MRVLAAIAGVLAALTLFVAVLAEPSALPDAELTAPEVVAEEVAWVSEPAADEVSFDDLAVAGAARRGLERRASGFRNDCSGFVAGVLSEVDRLESLEIPDQATVAVFRENAEQRGAVHHNPEPSIGDLVFFDNTWDRNGNGRMDDKNTHIAIVVDVEPDGTIVMAHKGSDHRLIRMNLHHPLDRHSPDELEWNSWLRRTGDRGNPFGMYLTGALWSGFAHVTPLAESTGRAEVR